MDKWIPIEEYKPEYGPVDIWSRCHKRLPNYKMEDLGKGNIFFSPVEFG